MPLMRPRQGRWLTGVCKGIALHLGIGVAWVRIAFIALTVLYGAGIIAYVFLWVFMPAGDPVAAAARTVPVNQAPLARGNQPLAAHDDESAAAPESLSEAIQRAPKPAVVALAGFALMATGLLLTSTGADVQIVFPLLVGLGGIALAWMNLSPRGTQLLSMSSTHCCQRIRDDRRYRGGGDAVGERDAATTHPRAGIEGARRGARGHDRPSA